MSFTEFKEYGLMSGVGWGLCYMKQNETKYHVLVPVESLPEIYSAPNTIEYSSTTNKKISSVPGKVSVNDIDIPVPYNLDVRNALEEINGKEIAFAYIDLEKFMGVTFVGIPTYRLSEIATDNIATITLNLKVVSASDGILTDLYDLYEDTISFNDNLPTIVELSSTVEDEKKVTLTINTTPSDATTTWKVASTGIVKVGGGSLDTGSVEEGKLEVEATKKGATIITLTSTSSGFASNKREIKVFVDK